MVLAAELAVAQMKIHGLPVSIQHSKGTTRIIKDDSGKIVWKKHMHSHYGELANTKGRDGDPVDVMVGPLGDKAASVYVVHMIDQNDPGKGDEDKCMLGYPSAEAARQAFHLQYPKDFFQSMTVLPVAEFKKRLAETQKPHTHNTLHASKIKCPRCGDKHFSLMPTDFETAKCKKCGKTWNIGLVKGINAPVRTSIPTVKANYYGRYYK